MATPRKKAPKLYYLAPSANSIGVLTLIKNSKLDDIELQVLDAMKGETRTEEFMAKNPFHCCPTLEHGSFVMWESGAVHRYIAELYKLEQWYPTDLKQRAIVNQVMDYRQCSYYPKVGNAAYPVLGFTQDTPENVEAHYKAVVEEIEVFCKYYLKDGKFAGGLEKPTIADLQMIPPMHFLMAKKGFELPAAAKAYFDRFVEAVPEYSETSAALAGYIAMLHEKQ